MSKSELLIIDDEAQIRKMLRINLESNGYKITEAANGKEGLALSTNHPPDLILLDIGLPDINGQQVLKELRKWYSKPIIILSVQNNEENIVKALDNGANDYLSKPFRTGELLARIRSAIRSGQNYINETTLSFESLHIDLSARTVKMDGIIIKLTTTEYSLLALLAKNEGRVLTHQNILKEIWGIAFQTETQYLRVFIAQLRKKIEKNPNHPKHIITESGVGYRFQ